MPTAQQIAELQTSVDGIVALVVRDLESLGSAIDPANRRAATDLLLQVVPDILDAYADATATVAADWYDQVRESVATDQPFTAQIGDQLPEAQVAAMVRWAVTPLWETGDWDAALRNLVAGSSRLVRLPSREVIERNAFDDPAAGRFVRIARPDACPFCLMLASRGAVYRSRLNATVVGGSGRSFHDHCRCVASPVFGPEDIPKFNRSLAEEWQTVTAGRSGRDALAAWTEHFALTRV